MQPQRHIDSPAPDLRTLQCPVIDVDAELAHWRLRHGHGELGREPFDEYAALLKLGYDVWLGAPRATEGQLYEALLEAYRRQHPTPAVSWDETRWLVRRAWHRLVSD
ncbi:MAG TPA: hypothetical protein VGC74_02565 [Stenotrophomonas sp.]|jgi:hypothetical protein